jgi:RHS repeat-associated protein
MNLLGSSSAISAGIHANPGGIVAGAVQPGSALLNFLGQAPVDPALPKAGLNILFFDERFNFVSAEFRQIEQEGDQCQPLVLAGIQAPQNGYAIVFVSNHQQNSTVLFDDLVVNHQRGQLLQEDHYYPDGLKMASICARAFSKGYNAYGFQGAFSEEEEESGYNEFDLRLYDPQIGRWISADPYDEFASPYVGMGGDPVNFTDKDGGSILDSNIPGDPIVDMIMKTIDHIFDVILGAFSGYKPPLQDVVVQSWRPKAIKAKEVNEVPSNSSPSVPYSDMASIGQRVVESHGARIDRLREDTKLIDGKVLGSIFGRKLFNAIDHSFMAIDFYKNVRQLDRDSPKEPLTHPLIPGAMSDFITEHVENSDLSILRLAVANGYSDMAALLNNSQVGGRTGIFGVYVTSDEMLKITTTGKFDMNKNNFGVLSPYPTNPSSIKYNYFILMNKKEYNTNNGVVSKMAVIKIN